MNKLKRILIITLSVLSMLCYTFAVGCAKNPLSVDRTPTGSLGLTFEYMTDAEIPFNAFDGITEANIKSGMVTFVFESPKYTENGKEKQNVLSSVFPGVYCNVVGKWSVTYVFDNKHDTKTFEVVDSIKPVFDVASRAYDVWFDAEYDLDENNQVQFDENGKRIFKKDAEGKELLGTRYSLPMIFPSDLSEFDYNQMTQTLVLDAGVGKLETIKILPGDKYYVPAVGKLTYTIGIADIHGNYNEYTASWNAKDPKWKDDSLDAGYLADYNEAGYINTASSGRASSYWANTELEEEWLEEFEGADGVLKVTAEPNTSACGAFKFKLFGNSTQSDAKGKSMVIKFYTPNNVSSVRIGASTWQNQEYNGKNRGVEAVNTVVCDVIPGQWNYAVVPYSQLKYGYYDLGDTNLSEYQICFGERLGPYMAEDIVLYVDAVGLTEERPEVTGYNFNGNVLTWDDIEGAGSYEVIEDGVKVIVETNAYTVKDADAEIRVRALSSDITKRLDGKYASRFVNVDKSNYESSQLAKFDSEKYVDSVEKSNRANRAAKSLDVKVLSSYEGENNVLKVKTQTNSSGVGDFRIKLPKNCVDGITLKFMISQSDINYFYWLNPSVGWETSISDDALILVNQPVGSMAGVWQYVYIPYSSSIVKDVIEVLVLDSTSAEGVETEVYFAKVYNGDCRAELQYQDAKPALDELATSLTGDYLADFSSEAYRATVAYSVSPNRATSITTEYLSSYADSIGAVDSGVMKITTTNNTSKRGNVRIYLPKASESGIMTVKFMVEKGSATMWFIDPNTNATEIKQISGGVAKYAESSTWVYMTLNQSAVERNCIEFLFANSAVGATNVLYIACVMEGDKVDYLKNAEREETRLALAEQLPSGYLADFSSNSYELLIANSKYNTSLAAKTLTAEYVSSFGGKNGLIKITTVNNDNGSKYGGFAINLPKDMPKTTGFTVTFYIESTTSRALRIINPATNSVAVSFKHEWVDNTLDAIVGQWVSVYVPYSTTYADAGTVEFMFFMNKTSGVAGTNVIYIDSIVEGNQTV